MLPIWLFPTIYGTCTHAQDSSQATYALVCYAKNAYNAVQPDGAFQINWKAALIPCVPKSSGCIMQANKSDYADT
jgi:hypothetical protein